MTSLCFPSLSALMPWPMALFPLENRANSGVMTAGDGCCLSRALKSWVFDVSPVVQRKMLTVEAVLSSRKLHRPYDYAACGARQPQITRFTMAMHVPKWGKLTKYISSR